MIEKTTKKPYCARGGCLNKAWRDGRCYAHHPNTVQARGLKRREKILAQNAAMEARMDRLEHERALLQSAQFMLETLQNIAHKSDDHASRDAARAAVNKFKSVKPITDRY